MKLDNIVNEIVLDKNRRSGFYVKPFTMNGESSLGRMLGNIPITIELDSEESGLYLCRLDESQIGLTSKYGIRDSVIGNDAFNKYDIRFSGSLNPEVQIRPIGINVPGFPNPVIRLDLQGWNYSVSRGNNEGSPMQFYVDVDYTNI